MNQPSATPARVSIRLRLTLWNAGVLALLLTIFAITAWITLRRVLAQRGDATVRESARAIAGAVIAERRTARERGDTSRVARTAARDVLRELRMGDRRSMRMAKAVCSRPKTRKMPSADGSSSVVSLVLVQIERWAKVIIATMP